MAVWQLSAKATVFLVGWYLTSLTTLFLNKHILSSLGGSAQTLGMVQMTTTFVLGAVKVHGAQCLRGRARSTALRDAPPPAPTGPAGRLLAAFQGLPEGFVRDMASVGVLRFLTVMAGLLAMSLVPVSFVETIKSTAPLFTVAIATVMLNERFSARVKWSLVPVVAGLAAASVGEIRFHVVGFSAAVFNNVVDVVQNVYSKRLLAAGKLTPNELQYYTSAAAIAMQAPLWAATAAGPASAAAVAVAAGNAATYGPVLGSLTLCLALNGASYHLQSVMAYQLMGEISPVTHAVANTAKRALLIWLSVLAFGNPMSWLSVSGIGMVVVGVLLYNAARAEAGAGDAATAGKSRAGDAAAV